jgi:hypothetical protein
MVCIQANILQFGQSCPVVKVDRVSRLNAMWAEVWD